MSLCSLNWGPSFRVSFATFPTEIRALFDILFFVPSYVAVLSGSPHLELPVIVRKLFEIFTNGYRWSLRMRNIPWFICSVQIYLQCMCTYDLWFYRTRIIKSCPSCNRTVVCFATFRINYIMIFGEIWSLFLNKKLLLFRNIFFFVKRHIKGFKMNNCELHILQFHSLRCFNF